MPVKRYQWITLIFFVWTLVVAVELSDRFRQVAHYVFEDFYDQPQSADSVQVSPTREVPKPTTKTKTETPKSTTPNFPVFRMFHF